MLADDRLNAIVRMVTEAGSMSVADLAEALDVTASTIRRDLQTLDRAHRLAKVHGGATSLERAHIARDLTIPERSELHVDDKRAIVQAAACLIEPGSFVYIDSGSTTLQLVSCVPADADVAYVTNSVGHARRLMERGCRVMVTGGELKPETEALVGPDATAMLARYRSHAAFGVPRHKQKARHDLARSIGGPRSSVWRWDRPRDATCLPMRVSSAWRRR